MDVSSANRKLSGFHGGISPAKSALLRSTSGLAVIRKESAGGWWDSPGKPFNFWTFEIHQLHAEVRPLPVSRYHVDSSFELIRARTAG